jgi:DNA-binding NtrC family response regulator
MAGVGHNLLLVDDDLAFRVATKAFLEDHGYAPTIATSSEEAVRLLGAAHYDLVLSDLVMPGMNGLSLLQHIKSQHPDTIVIMITGFASVKTAVEAMRLGARDYVTKPCDNSELLIKIQRALDEKAKEAELHRLREEVRGVYAFGNLVGQSAAMREVYRLVQLVAATDVTALILGETGTGKELVAKAIHYNSSRQAKPFVVINCSALAGTLLESELFGHERGAFTGAHRQRAGKFEEAAGGTVFLDEIGDVPLDIQTKLLRVLQENEIQRVGGNETLHVDTRVVAATNRDLPTMIGNGRFREDLFYRLNVFPIHLPPLRERLDDLPLLIDHLLKKHASLSQGRVKGISPALIPAMMAYEWKGNIRELENLIKRAIIKTGDDTITDIDIPEGKLRIAEADPNPGRVPDDIPFKEYMQRTTRTAETKFLRKLLDRHQGNITLVAQVMGVDRKTIYRMVENCGIDLSIFRNIERSTEDPSPH